MAYLKARAIVQRLRELVQDGAGGIRPIDAARFQGGLHEGFVPEEQARLGILDELPAEPRIVRTFAHPQRLTVVGNVQLVGVDVEVRIVRTVAIDGQVDDEIRDDISALAMEDASALRQVYEWPGNLSTTSSGEATDLISLVYVDSAARLVPEGGAGAAMRLETVHRFTGTAVERPTAA